MAAFKGDAIFWIETHKIVPNPYQPRREFDEEKLKELAESIRMYGVLQPLTVSRKEVTSDDGAFRTEYELIAGERRLRASKLAGLEQVPVIIREGEESEQEKLELAIIENLQREDLNAVDRALAFRQLAEVFNLSHSQVAKKVGRSREYVSNSIRLLNLPEYMLESIKTGDITEGHARTLLMLNDRPEEQDTLYRETLMKKLTVREVERIARKIATDKVRVQKWKGSDPELIEKEKQFTETLGTRVQLQKTDYGGKITIDYFSEEDLDTLLETLARTKTAMHSVSPITSAAQAVAAATTAHSTLNTLTEATPLASSEATDKPVPISPTTTEFDQHTTQSPTHTGINNKMDTTSAPVEPLVSEKQTNETVSKETAVLPPEDPHASLSVPTATDTTTDTTTHARGSTLRSKLAQLFGEMTPPASTPPVPAEPVSEAISDTPQETSDIPNGTTPTSPEADAATVAPAADTDDSDDDLYAVRHFSV